MKSKADIARENGKKGGRPKGFVALEAEMARKMIAEMLHEHLPAMIAAQIEKAKAGDTKAFQELLDRTYGKASQAVELTGKDGDAIQINISEVIAKKNDINTKSE